MAVPSDSKVTTPLAIPVAGDVGDTVAVRVRGAPYAAADALTCRVVPVWPAETTCVVEPVDARYVPSPEYDTVIGSDPTGRWASDSSAVPVASSTADPIGVPASVKVTEPVGVPKVPETTDVNTVGCPHTVAGRELVNVIVSGWRTRSMNVVDVDEAKFPSPKYLATSGWSPTDSEVVGNVHRPLPSTLPVPTTVPPSERLTLPDGIREPETPRPPSR